MCIIINKSYISPLKSKIIEEKNSKAYKEGNIYYGKYGTKRMNCNIFIILLFNYYENYYYIVSI